ncbi:hypothetical protein Agabi119p4_5319 [Agaricus bisporus var. burnettii]|uniref:Uncharacterized protein n=1 Tax=Agaricus bisporus var. burnettii TaxID=192524 RepID=A0A8H7F1G3_AGABI|nr:hypothetical protein Agabi119p4_5319 [Agaricus bisporus var. burnettii]
MENVKWPIDIDDGLDSESHVTQTFRDQTNHLIDPFSPSPRSRSYFVDIQAQESPRSPSVSSIRPWDGTVRSHLSITSSISPRRLRSPSPLSFLRPPSYTHPSTRFTISKPLPPEISFLDIPESRYEKRRRPTSFPLVTPPSSPITIATPSRQRHFRFRLNSFRRVPRHCRTVTWIKSLLNKRRRPKPTSNARAIPSAPNLNDVIADVKASNFSNSVLKLIDRIMGEDQKLRDEHDDCDTHSKKDGGRRVTEWFGSKIFTSRRSSPEAAPQVMETMRIFETELADDIVSLVDWRDFCMELLDGDATNECERPS